MIEDNDYRTEEANSIIRELRKSLALEHEIAKSATELRLEAEKERDDTNDNLQVVRSANVRLLDEVKYLKSRICLMRLAIEGEI